MARTSPLLGRLNAGELSPLLEGRPDLEFYAAGFRVMENMIPLVQGATTRRPGTRWIQEVKNSSALTHLLGFRFSTSQAYQLETGDRYLRFYRDKARIHVANTDAAISNGSFTSGITDWGDKSTGGGSRSHDATNGRLSLSPGGTAATDIGWAEQDVAVGVSFRALEHVLVFRVLGARGDQVELRIGTTTTGTELVADRVCGVGWHAVAFTPNAAVVYVQFRNKATTNNSITTHNKTLQIDDVRLLDNEPLELTTPYLQADIWYPVNDKFNPGKPRIKTVQSADLLYFHNPLYAEHVLSRTGDTSWSLTQVLHKDGPYLDENTTATTLTPSAATGSGVTLTASDRAGINRGAGFRATDVGRLVRAKEGSVWGWAIITGYTSPTVVTVDVMGTLTNTNAKTAWRLGLWSDGDRFPSCATFDGGRLVRGGGSLVRPQRFDGSVVGDYENFTPGTAAADPLSFNIDSDDVASIYWLASQRNLLIGTPSGIYAAFSDSTNAKITPTNINVVRQSKDGCADALPVPVSSVLLSLQHQSRRLREVAYTIEAEGYKTPDLSVRAEHILGRQRQLLGAAWQSEPFPVMWGWRSDGMLVGFTYDREQEVVAWHRHPIAGTDAAVEAVSIIPGPDGDEVWLIVRRTINGQTKRYIEVIERPLDTDDADKEAWYVDSGLQYTGGATSALSGLGHLEGEAVSLWTDKGVHPDRVVTGGQIALDFAVTQAQVGLPSTWILFTQRPEIGASSGTAQTKPKRIARIAIRLYRSMGIRIGPDAANTYLVPFRTAAENMGQAPPLFSGDKEDAFAGSWNTDGGVRMTGIGPAPVTLLAVVPTAVTNEG